MTRESDRRAVGTYEWVHAVTSIDFDESPELADGSGRVIKRPAGKTLKGVAFRISYWGDADGSKVYLGPARIAVCCEVDYKTAKAVLRTLCAYKLLTLVQRGGGIVTPEREGNGGEYQLTIPHDLGEIATVRSKAAIDAAIEEVKEKNRNKVTGKRSPRELRGTGTPVAKVVERGDTGQPVPGPSDSRGNEGVSHGATGSAIPTHHQPVKENQPSSLSARTSLPGPRDPADDREREGSTSSEDQTSTPTTAAQQMLAKHGVHGLEADQAESWIRRNVEHPIQGDGWWYAADGNGSLNTWVQRWRASLTPQSVEVEEIQYCPLHSRFPLYNCNVCWGDWMGGDDPYTGREDERPPGWWEAYDRQKRSGERGRSAEAEKSAGWMALPTSGDERPIMHPHHPNRLINSHANPDRYDVKL